MSSIEKRVKNLLASQLCIQLDDIKPESVATDFDSLDVVELIMSLEDEFKDELHGEELPEAVARLKRGGYKEDLPVDYSSNVCPVRDRQ